MTCGRSLKTVRNNPGAAAVYPVAANLHSGIHRTKMAVFDIDDTLFDASQRETNAKRAGLAPATPYTGDRKPSDYPKGKKAFMDFFNSPKQFRIDPITPGALDYVRTLVRDGYTIAYLTGRPNTYFNATMQHLKESGFPVFNDGNGQPLLFMKPSKKKKTTQFKYEVMRDLQGKFDIHYFYDDLKGNRDVAFQLGVIGVYDLRDRLGVRDNPALNCGCGQTPCKTYGTRSNPTPLERFLQEQQEEKEERKMGAMGGTTASASTYRWRGNPPAGYREAAGCIVQRGSDKKILLLRRSIHETSNHGMYELPGGKLEEGETPKEAALIETKEEAGLDVRIVQTLPPHVDNNSKKVYHGFVGAPKKGARVTLSIEHDDYKWVSIKQALAMPSGKLSHHARFLLGAMQAEESIKGTKIVKQPGPDGKNCGNCAHYCSKTNTCHLWSKKKGSKVFVLPDWFCQGYAAMPLPNPLPKPRKKNGRKEPSKKFVDRMMGNTKMRAEFPDAGQRYAVTLRLVEKHYGKAARKKIAPRENPSHYTFEQVKPILHLGDKSHFVGPGDVYYGVIKEQYDHTMGKAHFMREGRFASWPVYFARPTGETKIRVYAKDPNANNDYYKIGVMRPSSTRSNGLFGFGKKKRFDAKGQDSNGLNFSMVGDTTVSNSGPAYREYRARTTTTNDFHEVTYAGVHPDWLDVDFGQGPQRYQGPIRRFKVDRIKGQVEVEQGSVPQSQVMSTSERQEKLDALGPKPSAAKDPAGFDRYMRQRMEIRHGGRVNPSDSLPIYSGEPKGKSKNLGAVFSEVVIGRNIVKDVGEAVQSIYRGLIGGRTSMAEKRLAMGIASMQKELSDNARKLGGNALANLKMDYEVLQGTATISIIATADAIKMARPPKSNPIGPFKKKEKPSNAVLQGVSLYREIAGDNADGWADNPEVGADIDWGYMEELFPLAKYLEGTLSIDYYDIHNIKLKDFDTLKEAVDSQDDYDTINEGFSKGAPSKAVNFTVTFTKRNLKRFQKLLDDPQRVPPKPKSVKNNPAPSKKLKRAKDKYKKFHGGKDPVSVKSETIDVGDVWYALGPCWSIGYMSPKETGDDEQKYIHHTNEDSKDGNFPMMYATMPENGEPMIVIKGGSMKIGMRDGLAWLID